MDSNTIILDTEKNIFNLDGGEEIIYSLEFSGKLYEHNIVKKDNNSYRLCIKFPHNDENGKTEYYKYNNMDITSEKTTNFNIQIREIVKGFKEKECMKIFDLNNIKFSVLLDTRNIMNDNIISLLNKNITTEEEKEVLRNKEFVKIFNKNLYRKANLTSTDIGEEEFLELKRMVIIITGAFLTYANAIESTADDNKD